MQEMKFKYNIKDKPKTKKEYFLLSLQHVFAMFGSTILVPTLIGIDPATSLFTAGVGTLIYSQVTNKQVPVFIGSSFAYIAILSSLNQTSGANGIANAVISVGLVYILISMLIKFIGTNWIDKILPPIIIGPTIIIIGLSLAPTAISNSGLGTDSFNFYSILIALTSLLSTSFFLLKGSKTTKLIPVILGIFSGYLMAILLDLTTTQDLVNTHLIIENGLFHLPSFQIPFLNYQFSFDISIFLSILPIVLVTIAEHIGDHSVSSAILNKNFLKDPGLSKTILGDGLATLFAGLVGGVVNTTYAENTGVIILTRVASVFVIRLAAIISICLAFIGPVTGFIYSIPPSVMGGISILLFGMIAQNGIKILVNSKIDITHPRNLIIGSIILITGLGGATLNFSINQINFTFTGMSLAAISGIIFHLILPFKEVSYTNIKSNEKEEDNFMGLDI